MAHENRVKRFSPIQQNRDRPLIRQFYFHHFLKTPGFADESCGTNFGYEELIELTRFFCRRSGVERRAIAVAHVGIESKLRNRQHASANIQQAAIHLSVVVFENTQAGNLSRQVTGISLGIVSSNPPDERFPRPIWPVTSPFTVT